jgi:predicted ATPase/uncharacterized protein HemY
MALHAGTAEERDGDYYGPPLNRIARLLAVGHGDQILVSLAAAELARDRLPEGASLRDMGQRRLKDLVRPEQVFQLTAPDLAVEFPPLRSLETYPNNLPVQLNSFIGREKEMESIQEQLSAGRMVTLTGAGGCGKTRLALQVAAGMVERFAEGVWLVELAPLSEPTLVAQAVAAAVGVREEAGRSLTQTLIDALRSRDLLLVLDNCEHLIAACARLAQELLQSCPQLRILATSREALGIPGEIRYRVPTLSLPDVRDPPTRERLAECEAVRLFMDRAVTVSPACAITDENATAVAHLCHRLDGIPLAIELAAARVRVLSVEQIATRLDDRFRLLTGGNRTALPRQQTMRAAIDWSYELLSETERVLLGRLSVFAGGFTLEAAEAICAGDPVEEWEVLDLLEQLIEKSLVIADPEKGETRYRLLETIRQYGWEKVAGPEASTSSSEEAGLRTRHRDWFLALAEQAAQGLQGAAQASWLTRLETEHENLRAALDWSVERAEAEPGLRLGGALWRFWMIRGYMAEGRRRLSELPSLIGAADRTEPRAKVLNGAGMLAYRQGEFGVAQACHEESLAIYTDLGDSGGIAASLRHLGLVASDQGEYEKANTVYNESLAIYRRLGDRAGAASVLGNLGLNAKEQGDYTTAWTLLSEGIGIWRELQDRQNLSYSLHNLGMVAWSQGDYGKAQQLYEESLSIKRELGDRWGAATTLQNLGNVFLYQSNYDAARVLHEESLAVARDLGNRLGVAMSLSSLGIAAKNQGDYERARALYGESLTIRREVGDPRGIALTLHNLAIVALELNEYETAQALCEESLALRRKLELKAGIAASLSLLGNVTRSQGDLPTARALLEESLRMSRELGDKREAAHALTTLGAVARDGDDPPSARAHYRESLTLFAELGEQSGIAACLEGLGSMAEDGRKPQFLGAADALRQRIGEMLSPQRRAEFEQQVAWSRSQLEESAFAAAWAGGRAMMPEDAIAFALEPENAASCTETDDAA